MNSEQLDKVLSIQGYSFMISNVVKDECEEEQHQKDHITRCVAGNLIGLYLKEPTLHEFTTAKLKYNLGDGETETILLCGKESFGMVTDDKSARKLAQSLGINVIGSVFLLREAVRQGLLTCDESLSAFLFMKIKGGFLPKVDSTYLCA